MSQGSCLSIATGCLLGAVDGSRYFSALYMNLMRYLNKLTEASLTDHTSGENLIRSPTAAAVAARNQCQINQGLDSLAPEYTVPSYQGG